MNMTVAMTGGGRFRSSLALLAAFIASGVVTAAVVDGRMRSAPEPPTAPPVATDVRQVQDAPPVSEPPVKAAATAATAVPVVPPAPLPAVEARRPDTEALAEELQQLRDQVARLKQGLGEARADSQTMVLRDVDNHVAGIRTLLAQSQAEREENSEVAQRMAAQRDQAVQTLFAANQRLMTGDSDVLSNLDAAAPALPYPAQAALRNARARIESEDLYAARYWISVAITESGWSQLQ
jgi:hypothetical protein